MAEKPVDEPEILELSEVYGMLRRDARGMLYDLLDGVTLTGMYRVDVYDFLDPQLTTEAGIQLTGWTRMTYMRTKTSRD
ncbi:MAG: hypothetical protein ACRD6W_17430 [Nitrososphaerales archaeon]